jgi:hypothetical protein
MVESLVRGELLRAEAKQSIASSKTTFEKACKEFNTLETKQSKSTFNKKLIKMTYMFQTVSSTMVITMATLNIALDYQTCNSNQILNFI